MESKVREYQNLYDEFEGYYSEIQTCEEPIGELKKKIKALRLKQAKVDFNDTAIVVGYMETYVKEQIQKKEKEINEEIHNDLGNLKNSDAGIVKNFDRIKRWIPAKKMQALLNKMDGVGEGDINIKGAQNATSFNVSSIINKVLGFVFRLDFLKFLPKVLRVIAGIIVWGIILIPKIIEGIYNSYNNKYRDYLFSLSPEDYEVQRVVVLEDMIQDCIIAVALVVIFLILLNLVMYFLSHYFARKYLKDNAAVCLALIDENTFKAKCYETKRRAFLDSTVSVWNSEIEAIKANGVASGNGNAGSVFGLAQQALMEKYNSLETDIQTCYTKIKQIEDGAESARDKIKEIEPRIKEKENEVRSLERNSQHNEGCLSSYVSLGFSKNEKAGIKELISFKHKCKPMLFCYSDETLKDGIRFRKNIENIIERFMEGFYQENFHGNINMWLVDFEGLRFPESRTKGLMKVVSTPQGLQEMCNELKNTKSMVDSLADGKITTINPKRLKDRENPVKYNIVYFVSAEDKVQEEVHQLFIQGENFGFVPIMFMKLGKAQSILNDDSKSLYKVLKYIKDSDQIYGFEDIVKEFEYELMVSNQKKLLDEKVAVNKIISLDEFIDMASSDDGIDITGELYIDTYQLEENIYEALQEYDYIKYFSINGDIPEFISEDVIRL